MIFWLLVDVCSCYLLASSKIESCLRSNETLMDCQEKLVVSLSVQNQQYSETESLETIIDKVGSEEGEKELLYPIKVTLEKTRVRARYPIRYLRDFNNKPRELVIFTSIFDCEDDAKSKDTTCGWHFDSEGEKIWDSQGFCCRCEFDEVIGLDTDNYSRAKSCQAFNLGKGSASAHCLVWDDLWYSAYEIKSFETFYKVFVHLTKPKEDGSYELETLEVSPSVPLQYSKDVIVRLIGDFYPNQPPPSLGSNYLFMPSKPRSFTRVQMGSRYWMFIEKAGVSFGGTECNKVGTSFSAFNHQNNKCRQLVQSCFQDQLEDKHQTDLKRQSNSKAPLYFISKYGNFSLVLGSQSFLQLELQGRFSSLVTLEMNADKLRFVTNLSQGEIDYAEINTFEALSYDGFLECQVTNVGSVVAQFTLGGECSQGIAPLQAQEFSLKPLHSKTLQLNIYSEYQTAKNYLCNVTLFNSIGQVSDFVVVNFNTTARPTETGSQGGSSEGESFQATQEQKQGCSEVCPNWYDVPCFFAKGCWGSFLMFLGFLVGLVVVLVVVKFLVGKFCRCLSKKPKPS